MVAFIRSFDFNRSSKQIIIRPKEAHLDEE